MNQNDIKNLLKDAIEETGFEVSLDVGKVSAYLLERAAHLSTLTLDPGFNLAVRAERDAIALKSGISITMAADNVDSRLLGVMQGVLHIGAVAMAGV